MLSKLICLLADGLVLLVLLLVLLVLLVLETGSQCTLIIRRHHIPLLGKLICLLADGLVLLVLLLVLLILLVLLLEILVRCRAVCHGTAKVTTLIVVRIILRVH